MKKGYQISKAVCLVSYLYFLWRLYRLFWLGGLRNHLIPLGVSAVICFISCVLWVFFRIKAKENGELEEGKKLQFLAGLAIFLLGTAYFGGRIVYTAMPYNGALSWKLDELLHKKTFTLEHDNFFTDGIEGFLEEMDGQYGLPEELYISNNFQLTFDQEGNIRTIYTFLYGKDEKGEKQTYLVDYDRSASKKVSVWLHNETAGEYDEGLKLQPMLEILKRADCEKQVLQWAESYTNETYEILYYGSRSFSSPAGLVYLPGDADGDGEFRNGNYLEMLQAGGELKGYEVSLHIPGRDSEVTPVRYMMEPEYISALEIQKERESGQIEEAKKETSWSVDQSDGTMYFFLTETAGWRLVVTDAAAGSRFYVMEKTGDGGDTWERINEDPFGGSIGVTEGLIFYDDQFGFAGLSSASQSYSRLYVTRDGGVTFTEMAMPADTVTELPEIAGELGYTAENYGYLCMPEKNGDQLTVLALSGAGESEGILYQSGDQGETWTYAGIREYGDS